MQRSFWAGVVSPGRIMLACATLLLALTGSIGALPARAADAPLEALEIATRTGVVVLEVEVARTDEQRMTGLMYRKELPERQGMLFDFGKVEPVYMWMKNTYIPLDMLFVRADGTIARIEEMTTPFSTRTISSGEPVKVVVEIAGGGAKRLGIAPGDRLSTGLFDGK
ncbi:DUF192 domain-containing protein [Xanthobacter sp. DSM 24535]|uniref:DUF192 domain-containing protein n=1 Tax=Roseixanthobacter psychrophilus TaxID=3119917 RepID=UPI003729BC6B